MSQQMPNPIELYEAAAQGFRQTLSGVKENQMNSPTPCTEWNVQALINHNLKVAGFAHGALLENITTNPMEVAGSLPAEGAIAALEAGVAQILELIKAPGSADQQINTPFGQMTRGQFIMNPFLDLLVHTWDLAKGTGQNTTLDSGLVGVCYAAFEPQMDGMRSVDGGDGKHIIGPAVPVPASAGTLDKLIGMMGRQT
jgi:uncharacterized protein (TIGR03086 family)